MRKYSLFSISKTKQAPSPSPLRKQFESFSNFNANSQIGSENQTTMTRFDQSVPFMRDAQFNSHFLSSLQTNPECGSNSLSGANLASHFNLPLTPNMASTAQTPKESMLSRSTESHHLSQTRKIKKYCLNDVLYKKTPNLIFKSKNIPKKSGKKQKSHLLRRRKKTLELDCTQVLAEPIDISGVSLNSSKRDRSVSKSKQLISDSRSAVTRTPDKRSKSKNSILEKLQKSGKSLLKQKSSFDRALQLKQQQFYKKSLLFFNKVGKGEEGYSESLFHRAFLLDKQAKFEEAAELYEEFTQTQPSNAFGVFNWGICLKHLGKYKESLECFDKVLLVFYWIC